MGRVICHAQVFKGKPTEGGHLHIETLLVIRATLGEQHPETITSMSDHAVFMMIDVGEVKVDEVVGQDEMVQLVALAPVEAIGVTTSTSQSTQELAYHLFGLSGWRSWRRS